MNADTDGAPNPEKSADVDGCNSRHLVQKEDVRLRHFHPSREMFHLILERSHSYRDLLEGGESFARHLGVPLISDDVARGICEIFKVPRPSVLGPENGGCGGSVSWLDVVQETDYQAEPQQGGTYHCRLHDQGVWVQLSNYQHELLLTGLPQRLVHPWSYEKDVRTELETLALAITEISKWETLASEVLEVTKDMRMRAAKRIRILSGNLQPDRASENANANSDPQGVVSAEEDVCTPNCTEKRSAETLPLIANNRRWDPEQKRRVFQWFESQSRLSEEDVVMQFERDFGHRRSYSAIRSIWYQMRRQRQRREEKKESRRQSHVTSNDDHAPCAQPREPSGRPRSLLTSGAKPGPKSVAVYRPNEHYPSPSKSFTEDTEGHAPSQDSDSPGRSVEDAQPARCGPGGLRNAAEHGLMHGGVGGPSESRADNPQQNLPESGVAVSTAEKSIPSGRTHVCESAQETSGHRNSIGGNIQARILNQSPLSNIEGNTSPGQLPAQPPHEVQFTAANASKSSLRSSLVVDRQNRGADQTKKGERVRRPFFSGILN